MKTIKSVKVKATKTATKVTTAKTRAAIRPTRAGATASAVGAAVPAAKAKAKTEPTPASAATVAAIAPVAQRRELSSDVIAARAYVIWEQQGRPHGKDRENWLLAESQLKQEIQSFTA
jgi:hypothetical protein